MRSMPIKLLYKPGNEPLRVAAFMSGTGSNLRKILENKNNAYEVKLIFSDTASEKCKAKDIAKEYEINYICNDIAQYYTSINTSRKDMDARRKYDQKISQILKQMNIQAVVLCGYMSIVTEEILENFITINVHPADLSIRNSGKRLLAGCMGTDCIRKSIELGHDSIRSSTHLVVKEVDEGPIFMLSKPIKIENQSLDEENLKLHLERLKQEGDWKILPETLKRLANGNYIEEEGIIIDIEEEKQILRDGMKKIRDSISVEKSKELSNKINENLIRISEFAEAKNPMLYLSANNEVDVSAAIAKATSDGKNVVVPTIRDHKILPCKITSQLTQNEYGINEPVNGEKIAPAEIDLIIVPGICFDKAGNRIGYGKGYYDKLLKDVKCKKIGLAYESQIVDRIWTSSNDVAVDMIITEKRTITCVGG